MKCIRITWLMKLTVRYKQYKYLFLFIVLFFIKLKKLLEFCFVFSTDFEMFQEFRWKHFL